jgi:CHAD domain
MPHSLDSSITPKQRVAHKRASRRKPLDRGAIAPPLSVPFRVATRPVHSLHDAALTIIDGATETLRSGDGDEAVHAARKACKCIRAALRLLRQWLGPEVYRRENKRIRDAAKPLTAVRDAFILRTTLRRLNGRSIALERGLNSDYRTQRHALERRGTHSVLEQLTGTREMLLDFLSADSEAVSAIAGVRLQARAFRLGKQLYRHSAKHIEAAMAARLVSPISDGRK